MAASIARDELVSYCDNLLDCANWRDYAPNGLQVEGSDRIERIVTGVTACQALIDAAIERKADAILVHHGYFWKNEPAVITGMKRRRIAALLAHDINLIGYHLPLDGHPELGNNARLAQQLGMRVDGRFGHQMLGVAGQLDASVTPAVLADQLAEKLGHTPLVVGPEDRQIRRIGLCTGGAQDMISEAVELGLDAFISGEISERTTHIAREEGIVYFAAGHHATERGGPQALGTHLAEQFGLSVEFVDIDNPV